MTIFVPDPNPGRCKNYRLDWRNGQVISRRCLDYEDSEHVCTFGPLAPPMAITGGSVFRSESKPEPWVKP